MTTTKPTLGEGLSPRARGNLPGLIVSGGRLGPIPAGAGEPRADGYNQGRSRAYPRGRGGTLLKMDGLVSMGGLSPRARGNRRPRCCASPPAGPIPAGAGEPLAEQPGGGRMRAYPRGRGGTAITIPC